MKNKKAATFNGMIEVIIFGVIFLTLFALIVNGLNTKYNKNYDADFNLGLSNIVNDTNTNLLDLQKTFENQTRKGTANFFTASGLVVTTSYNMVLTVMGLLWSFASGAFINKSVVLMGLPSQLGLLLQMLYLLTIGFILLRLLFKPTGRV